MFSLLHQVVNPTYRRKDCRSIIEAFSVLTLAFFSHNNQSQEPSKTWLDAHLDYRLDERQRTSCFLHKYAHYRHPKAHDYRLTSLIEPDKLQKLPKWYIYRSIAYIFENNTYVRYISDFLMCLCLFVIFLSLDIYATRGSNKISILMSRMAMCVSSLTLISLSDTSLSECHAKNMFPQWSNNYHCEGFPPCYLYNKCHLCSSNRIRNTWN